jgi:hypothetical protein
MKVQPINIEFIQCATLGALIGLSIGHDLHMKRLQTQMDLMNIRLTVLTQNLSAMALAATNTVTTPQKP